MGDILGLVDRDTGAEIANADARYNAVGAPVRYSALLEANVPTPDPGFENMFLNLNVLGTDGLPVPCSKDENGVVKLRDDWAVIYGALRPVAGGDAATGTPLATYTADEESEFTNVGSNVEYDTDHYQLINEISANILDGNDGYFSTDAAMRDGGEQTFVIEFNMAEIPPSGIVKFTESSQSNVNGITLLLRDTGNVEAFMAAGGVFTSSAGVGPISINTDYRLLFSYDNSGSNLHLRVEETDGTLVGENTTATSADWNTGTPADGNWYWGCSLAGSGGLNATVKKFEMYRNSITALSGFNTYVYDDPSTLGFVEGDMLERAIGADLPNGEGGNSYTTVGNPNAVVVSDANSAVDTTVLNAAATNYAPATYEALDENDNPITDGNITIDYNINNAGFTGTLLSLNAFKALDSSLFAAATNLALRTRLILAQTVKSVSIQTVNSKSVLDSTGDIYTEVNGVVVHRLSEKEDIVPQVLRIGNSDDVKATIEGITDSSLSKPYTVVIGPGEYAIGDNSIAIPTYVNIKGEGTVILDYTGNTTKTTMTMAAGARLSGITIQNHLSSLYGVSITGTGSYVLDDVVFLNCTSCVNIDNAAVSVTIRGITLLPFASPMTNGVTVDAGSVTVDNMTIGGAQALTNALIADSSDAVLTARDFLSVTNTSLVNGVIMRNSSRCNVTGVTIVGATNGVAVETSSNAVINATVFNCGTGLKVSGNASIATLISSLFKDSTTLNIEVTDSPTVRGIILTDTNLIELSPTATVILSTIDDFEGDEALGILGELHVGDPSNPSETAIGEGDSYVKGILVYTYNGSVYTDVSAAAASATGSTFAFPNTSVNTAIYWASTLNTPDGLDTVKHHGLKLLIDTAQSGGTIIFEYYNGASWVEFNAMCTGGDSPYYPAAEDYFGSTGSCQIRYDVTVPNDSWAKNDDPSVGTDYYWIRARISSVLTTAPIMEQSKLHSSRMEINGDGWPEYFGNARPTGKLPWSVADIFSTPPSVANSSIFYSDNIDIGMTYNLLTSGDRVGFQGVAPFDFDSSSPIRVRIAFRGAAVTGVSYTIRWTYATPGSSVYSSAVGAPATHPNEQTLSDTALTNTDEIGWIEENLDFSGVLSRRDGGFPDMIAFTIEHDGGSDIALMTLSAEYTKWCEGGHIN